MKRGEFHFDRVVIGSGFGGSVAALRFSEKGYRVGVIEQGRRWRDEDFPRSNWNIAKYVWLPQAGLRGLFEFTFTRKLVAVHASGVGGGSLIYANVHLIPERSVFQSEGWSRIRPDWYDTLLPFYALAKRMLGVARNPYENLADQALRRVAQRMGDAASYRTVDVAICFGPDGEEARSIPDPYFAGDGPDRAYCRFCGGCMVGCRYNAKNTLAKNYLHFAERNGVQILPERRAVRIEPLPSANGTKDGEAGYEISVETGGPMRKRRTRIRARGVTIAAGVLASEHAASPSRPVYSGPFRCYFDRATWMARCLVSPQHLANRCAPTPRRCSRRVPQRETPGRESQSVQSWHLTMRRILK